MKPAKSSAKVPELGPIDLFKHPYARKITLVMFFNWIVVTLGELNWKKYPSPRAMLDGTKRDFVVVLADLGTFEKCSYSYRNINGLCCNAWPFMTLRKNVFCLVAKYWQIPTTLPIKLK